MQPPIQSTHTFRRGQIIPPLTHDFWQVERGILQLQTQDSQGKITILGWLQTGSFWGNSLTNLAMLEAIALTDCTICRLTLQELQTSDHLKQAFLRATIKRLRQTEYLLAITGLRPIEDRLIKLLLFLRQELGQPEEQNIRLRCRFTHKNLAEAIGTTRVTITRLLKEFQGQRWLYFDEDRHLLFTPLFPLDQSITKVVGDRKTNIKP